MTKIYLSANDQLLAVTTTNVLASGNQNTVEVHIDFSEEWNGLTTSAVFFTKENPTIYEKVLNIYNDCVVPAEVLAKSGTLFIGARGVDADDVCVKASTLVKYKIKDGAPSGQGTSVEPTADVYQQILTAYGEAKSEVIDIRARYEETLKKAYKSYDLLWENPNPNDDYASSAIVLGAETKARYSEFLITYKSSKSNTKDESYVLVKNRHEYDGETITGTAGGYSAEMSYCSHFDGSLVELFRNIDMHIDNYISIDDCKYIKDGEIKVSNSSLIPCKIYGVRQNIVTNIDDQVAAYLEEVFIPTTQAKYDAMVEAGTVDKNKYYMIVG